MPKLPANYVKAPGFDNPLRATGGESVSKGHKLALRLDDALWKALTAASEHAGESPEAFVTRTLTRLLNEPVRPVQDAEKSPAPPTPQPSRRALLLDQLLDHWAQRSWTLCLTTLRQIVQEGRSGS